MIPNLNSDFCFTLLIPFLTSVFCYVACARHMTFGEALKFVEIHFRTGFNDFHETSAIQTVQTSDINSQSPHYPVSYILYYVEGDIGCFVSWPVTVLPTNSALTNSFSSLRGKSEQGCEDVACLHNMNNFCRRRKFILYIHTSFI